jgi:CBS domain containing-hemolysin-like protein
MAAKAWQFQCPVQFELCRKHAALTLHLDQDSLSFMALLRGLFWLVLFIVLAFSFVVLFEYGPKDFANGFRKEFARAKTFVVKQAEKIQKPKK